MSDDQDTTKEFVDFMHAEARFCGDSAADDPESGPCHYCDSPGELLCDFVLSFYPYKTCDRRLCKRHATNKGVMFICGEDGGIVTEDFCPGHAKGPRCKPRYNPIGGPRGA